jgi:hypothetical protein
VTTQSSYCPSCGKARHGSMRFCDGCGYDYVSTVAGATTGNQTTAPPVSSPVAPRTGSVAPASVAAVVGGLLVAVGSFLPWVTASTVFGSLSRSGIDGGGDGWVTLIAGSVIALLGLITINKPNRGANLLIAVAAAVAFLIVALDFSDIQSRIASVESESEGMALGGVGIGLWMVALGAIVAFVASLMRRSLHKRPAGGS